MKKVPNNLQDLFVDADYAACKHEEEAQVKFTDEEYFEFVRQYIAKVVKS